MNARYCFVGFFLLAVFTGSVALPGDQVLPSLENGDYNGDGSRNITDAINIFRYLFTGGATPPAPVTAGCELDDPLGGSTVDGFVPTLQNGDVNGDGSFNLTDGVHFLTWLFAGGAAPATIECHLAEE